MKYIKIERSDSDGSYTQPIDSIACAVDGELYDAEAGTEIKLTVIEMTDEEYKQLPEFMGW